MGNIFSNILAAKTPTPIVPRAMVAFSPKKMILAEYAERVGIEPGDKEYENCRKYFTLYRWVKDTWDIYYGNQLKNRFKLPWRPRAPHRWKWMGYVPFVFGFFYFFEWGMEEIDHVYQRNSEKDPVWMDRYEFPHAAEYFSRWTSDEVDKWRQLEQSLRLRSLVKRNEGPKPPRYKPPPPEDYD